MASWNRILRRGANILDADDLFLLSSYWHIFALRVRTNLILLPNALGRPGLLRVAFERVPLLTRWCAIVGLNFFLSYFFFSPCD